MITKMFLQQGSSPSSRWQCWPCRGTWWSARTDSSRSPRRSPPWWPSSSSGSTRPRWACRPCWAGASTTWTRSKWGERRRRITIKSFQFTIWESREFIFTWPEADLNTIWSKAGVRKRIIGCNVGYGHQSYQSAQFIRPPTRYNSIMEKHFCL